MTTTAEADIWGRIFGAAWDDLSPEAAQQLLRLQFNDEDKDRVAALSALANEGELDQEQRQELERYLDVASVLAVMHSRARRALRQDGAPRRKVS